MDVIIGPAFQRGVEVKNYARQVWGRRHLVSGQRTFLQFNNNLFSQTMRLYDSVVLGEKFRVLSPAEYEAVCKKMRVSHDVAPCETGNSFTLLLQPQQTY